MIASLKARLTATIGFNPVGWAQFASAMPAYLTALDVQQAEPTGPKVLVPVIPWLGTSIPWLSLAVGRMLGAMGAQVSFVLDDQPFDRNGVRQKAVQAALIPSLEALRADHTVLRLSEIAAGHHEPPAGLIENLASWNAIWALRGEVVDDGRAAIEARNAAKLGEAFAPIAAVFDQTSPDLMFIPGGIFGTSGLWAHFARAKAVRVASFDNGGLGTWVIAADGLACHHGDIARAVEIFDREMEPAERAEAIALAASEIAARRQGTDLFSYQIKGAGSGSRAYDDAVLIALNSSWDSAALGVHEVFESNTQWIVETVRHLLENTQTPVVVRQHPAERFAEAATSDNYGALLQTHFGEHPRLHFIAATDPINTYAILEQVRAVIVHSSTIGTDAASMGLPVITSSNAYFSGIGFASKARTREEYFALIDRACASELAIDARRKDLALLCYFTAQVANWVRSDFNPGDVRNWHGKPLAHWLAEPATRRMLTAIRDNCPVAVLNHRAMREAASQGADPREVA